MPDVATTAGLPAGQRFEYWKHVLSNTFVPLEVTTPGGGNDFRGLVRGCELGSLRFIEVSAEAHTARRTARLVKAAPAIGARWGYPDPAHFSRLFKAAYGVGPRDYRASVRTYSPGQAACAGVQDGRRPGR
jgi:hypothetical protein